MSSDNLSGSCSGSKTLIEDEEEEVIYRPPVVSSKTPLVDSPVPSNLSDSQSNDNNPDADCTPLTLMKESLCLEMLPLILKRL